MEKVATTIRLSKTLHRALVKEAKSRALTLNALIITKLENETTSKTRNKENPNETGIRD